MICWRKTIFLPGKDHCSQNQYWLFVAIDMQISCMYVGISKSSMEQKEGETFSCNGSKTAILYCMYSANFCRSLQISANFRKAADKFAYKSLLFEQIFRKHTIFGGIQTKLICDCIKLH